MVATTERARVRQADHFAHGVPGVPELSQRQESRSRLMPFPGAALAPFNALILRDRLVDELGEVMRVLELFIQLEGQTRGVAQLQLARDLSTQKTRGALQAGEHRSAIGAGRAGSGPRKSRGTKGQHVHVGDAQISREPHGGHGDVADPRVLDITAQQRCEQALNLRGNALGSGVGGAHWIVRNTSTRAKHSI